MAGLGQEKKRKRFPKLSLAIYMQPKFLCVMSTPGLVHFKVLLTPFSAMTETTASLISGKRNMPTLISMKNKCSLQISEVYHSKMLFVDPE